jgi:hypothetical protein
MSPMRDTRQPHRRRLQMISPVRRTNITQKPTWACTNLNRVLPKEAKASRNSLSWKILQNNFFVLKILRRNPACKLKKTRNLPPKYGWGYSCRHQPRKKNGHRSKLHIP